MVQWSLSNAVLPGVLVVTLVAGGIAWLLWQVRKIVRRDRKLSRLYRDMDAMAKEIKDLMHRIATDGDYSVRVRNPHLVRCWEVKKCGQARCPSYGRLDDLRCWEVSGTFCRGEIQGVFAKKLGNCRKCSVYQAARQEAVFDLAESFNEMILMIGDRHQSLDDMNRELAAEIERADRLAAQAQQAARAKSEFLANISHELRTPLHGILSYSRFGVNEAASAERSELQGFFRNVNHCAESLLHLVNDLLDLSKLEAGRMTFDLQATDLGELVESVAGEFASLCAERGVTIRYEKPADAMPCLVDPVRIQQVVRNLLSNAVKFSPQDAAIDVQLQHQAEALSLSIRDAGPGIPADELEAVFDKFVQSSKTKSNEGGTGLGLAICREIVNGHHGRVWAENNVGSGCVLFCELPAADDESLCNASQSSAVF